ncbi:uncharacterized protein A4U43_C05F4160 [Asparagus officinalis]|uniref:Elongator complex protein 6 n=1 Tax=Asparagus officinalis TaxID=4686 RepID=A0A5P1EQ95_ASPOF|nr:elongator complex protein 6 [Asparagus officinalis]ONK67823.1 uncharacterized protein A4U43_C05F4160 [Asparagus officinalis]
MNSPSNLLDDALGPIPGPVILVEDRVETSGAFVLHHLLKRSLAADAGGAVVFLALAQTFSHYDRIMRKMGYNLSAQRENKKVLFLDMMKLEYPSEHKDGLIGLYAKIQSAIESRSSKENITIMIDDISLLEIAARGSADDVLDFMHYCVALTSELGCSLVILNHEDIYPSGEEPPPTLHSNLEYLADVVVKTEPLLTGLAVDVHGQLTIIRKVVLNEKGYSASKISNFHFKVKENGVEYFHPGSQR